MAKRFLITLAAASLMAGAAYADESSAGRAAQAVANWTFTGAVAAMTRSSPDARLLSFELGGPPPSLVDAGQFDFDFAAGGEVSITRHGLMHENVSLEARYFGAGAMEADVGPVAATFPVFNYASPFFFGAPGTSIAATYDSEFHSVELNARLQTHDWLQVLAGVRYLDLDETLVLVEQVAGGPGVATTGAQNKLWGVQIGADARVISREQFSLTAAVRAGIFDNSAANSTTVTLGGALALLPVAASGSNTATLVELGLTGIVRLTDHIALRGTYQFTRLGDIATASEQFPVSDPAAGTASLSASNDVNIHSIFVGIQVDLYQR